MLASIVLLIDKTVLNTLYFRMSLEHHRQEELANKAASPQPPQLPTETKCEPGSDLRQSMKAKKVGAVGALGTAKKKKKTLPTDSSPLLQEHKAAITIGIIMGVFLLCWAPFFVVNVTAGLCPQCISPLLFKVLTWLGYSNSAFNPIIYSIFNVEFREAFQKTLTQRPGCCAKNQINFV